MSCARPLQADVEAQAAVLGDRDERLALLGREPREHGVGRVRLRLVREVDARDGPLEQPAGEDTDLDVRRLQPPVRPRHAPGLDGDELEPAVVLRPGAAEAEEAVLERDVVTVVGRVPVAAGGVRLPDLDHAVGHAVARAVGQPAADADRARVVRVDERRRDQLFAGGRSAGTGPAVCDGVRPSSVIVRLLERRRLAAAEHDVPAEAERPLRLGQLEVEGC